jgi:WD40 repeat protein
MSAPATALYSGRIYPGLRPFDAEDALLFFGRDRQIDELLRRLDETRFLAVVGLSGGGKSSLVRAGLLPALRRGHLRGAGSHWRISIMRPGSDPLGALARALDETLGERDDRLRTLRSGRLGLLDASRYGRRAEENVLLVVDQFEELFRFQDTCRERSAEASEFVELLLAAGEEFEPVWRVYVVITLRSDYLGECARFCGLPEALNDSQYLVPRMTREQLREAIVGPAALGGVEVSKELWEELLDKTGDEPDQLPVLQHLLMRMWEKREQTAAGFRITKEHYTAAGGWDDALNNHADAVWNELGARRDAAKRMLQRLTERAQAGREVRRPATVRELAEVADARADEVIRVVEHFWQEGCNFLTSPDRELNPDSVIDISHESLIRQWKRLNEWTTEEAGWGEWYRRVEDTLSFGGAWLVNPALESALEARRKGRWNAAWAERYAKSESVRPAYSDVIRFLEESWKRRGDELTRLRRTRALVVVAALLFACLAVAASWFWWVARRSEEGALARQLASDSGLLRNLSVDWTTAALLGIESLRREDTEAGYEAVFAASSGIGREVGRVAHQAGVIVVAFSPDGTLAVTGSEDSAARVFDVRAGREVANLPHQGPVYAVAFSPDSALVATGSADETARVYEARTGREVARLAHQGTVFAVSFSPDGRLVATCSADNEARVFEASTGREVARLAHQGTVYASAFSQDGTLVVTRSTQGSAQVFEARTRRLLARLAHQSDPVVVVFSSDAKLVAVASWDKTARVFEARSGREVAQLADPDRVMVAAFSSDGALLATGSADSTARVYEARTGREVARLAHQGPVRAVAFSSDGTLMATGSEDTCVRVFRTNTWQEVARLAHHGPINAVAFSPYGSRLVVSGSGGLPDKPTGEARVFEVRTGRRVAELAHPARVGIVTLSPDGTLVATGSVDGTARVFEVRTGRELARLAHQAAVSSVAFSPDASLVATGYMDGTAWVFEARTGREVAHFNCSDRVEIVALSSDGVLLALGPGQRSARVFDVRARRELAELEHSGRVKAIILSPDGNLVAMGTDNGNGGEALVFETHTRRQVARLTHQHRVEAIALSPDARMLATGSADRTARVFELATGREVAHLTHQGSVYALAFSPDGALVATGSEDNTARVFEARTGREVSRKAHLDNVLGVVFSPDSRLVATRSAARIARAFEARTGRELARLTLGDLVRDVDFASGGRFLRAVSGTTDLLINEAPVETADRIADACSKLDRNLTREEWTTYLGKRPYRQTCDQLNPASSRSQSEVAATRP